MAPQPTATNTFTPKQAYPKDPQLYHDVAQNTTKDAAKHVLIHLLPPISPDAVIHDNGCGIGEVTSQIMSLDPPPIIAVHATDMDENMLKAYTAQASLNKWPAKASNMRAESLEFPDDYFTLSFTNFVIHHLEETTATEVAKQIHRTIKPNGEGVAVVTSGAIWPFMPAFEKAHTITRGADAAPWLKSLPTQRAKAETLKEIMRSGGFEEAKIRIETCDIFLTTPDLRIWIAKAWSGLGARADGWWKEDEEKWDEFVDIAVRELETGPNYKKLEGGDVKLRFRANIAVATK